MSVKIMNEDKNYDVTEGECPECEEGALYVNTHELVCEDCHHVFRNDGQHAGGEISIEDPVVEFYKGRAGNSDKHRYSNSGKPILPGGFENAYDPNKDNGIYGDNRNEDELLDTKRVA